MKSVYNFVVKPKGDRYNNTKKLDGGELILNTEIYNHQFVNREAIVSYEGVVPDGLSGKTEYTNEELLVIINDVNNGWYEEEDE